MGRQRDIPKESHEEIEIEREIKIGIHDQQNPLTIFHTVYTKTLHAIFNMQELYAESMQIRRNRHVL